MSEVVTRPRHFVRCRCDADSCGSGCPRFPAPAEFSTLASGSLGATIFCPPSSLCLSQRSSSRTSARREIPSHNEDFLVMVGASPRRSAAGGCL